MDREKRSISGTKKQKTSKKGPTFEIDNKGSDRKFKDKTLKLDSIITSNTNFPRIQVPDHIEKAMRKVMKNQDNIKDLIKNFDMDA